MYTGHGWVTEQHSEAIEERGRVQLYGNDTEVEEQSAHVTYTPRLAPMI
ncbi:hypothetical protein [Geomicrobium sp. JCM 19039]|nr:hypothetical protein [Geomicrobium sp. JCM 19039]